MNSCIKHKQGVWTVQIGYVGISDKYMKLISE